MLAGSLPEKINFTRTVEEGTTIQGTIALWRFSRFASLVTENDPFVDVSLGFRKDMQQQIEAVGSAEVRVQLLCQKCLELLDYEVAVEVRTILVRDREALDSLTPSKDGIVVTSTLVDPVDIFEDELILGLPMAPRHESSRCTASTSSESGNLTRKPFAGLSKLVKD